MCLNYSVKYNCDLQGRHDSHISSLCNTGEREFRTFQECLEFKWECTYPIGIYFKDELVHNEPNPDFSEDIYEDKLTCVE